MQAFINTHYDLTCERGGETLYSPEAMHGWLVARHLIDADQAVDHADVRRVLAVREGLRALAFANNNQRLNTRAIDAMRAASHHAGVQIRIEPDGPQFVAGAAADINAALGRLLALTARAMIENAWPRLKACPGRHCGWAFYDHSRNHSARWCSMKVCGDREKARAYYQRQIA